MTQTELKELLHYNSDTGLFIWKVQTSNRIKVGSIAGYTDPRGYVDIMVSGTRYYAHKLAWFYVYGVWPKQLDHKNGNPSDNRIENLRLATTVENGRNRKRQINNKAGFKGIYWNRQNRKWQAQIVVNGKQKYLGLFDSKEDAANAYDTAAKRYFGEFANLNSVKG